MYLKTRVGSAALVLASLLTLTACKTEPPSGTETTSTTQESVPDLSGDVNNPGHYYEKINDQISIDTQIMGPSEGVTPKVYVANLPEMDIPIMETLLKALGDDVGEIRADEYEDDSHTVIMSTKSGGYADLMTISIDSNFPGWNMTYKTSEYVWYSNAYIDYGPVLRNEVPEVDNTELYTEPKEFSFATPQEAEEEVRELLKSIGIENIQRSEIFYLDHKIMAEAEKSDAAYDRMTKGGSEEAVYKEEWTEADDAYAMRFDLLQDGITTLPYNFTRTTRTYANTTVDVIYNKNGIVRLYICMPWLFEEEVETPTHLVTANEVLNIAQEKLGKSKPPYERIVDDISMRYYYVQDKDRWLLRPCWLVMILNKDKPTGGEMVISDHSVILIDAITGEEF